MIIFLISLTLKPYVVTPHLKEKYCHFWRTNCEKLPFLVKKCEASHIFLPKKASHIFSPKKLLTFFRQKKLLTCFRQKMAAFFLYYV